MNELILTNVPTVLSKMPNICFSYDNFLVYITCIIKSVFVKLCRINQAFQN